MRTALLNAEAEALAARILLDELRAGRLATAMELLEQTVDSGVVAIDSLGQKLGSAEREQAAAALRVLRDYRQRHPRKREAHIDGADESSLRQTESKVGEILHAAS